MSQMNQNLRTHMYDWVFTFNIYTRMWEAYRKEDYGKDGKFGKAIRSNNLDTLVQVVNRKLYKTL